MSKAKIFYFTLQDEQTKDEKLDWFDRARFEAIPFDHLTPDQKANWINLTDNDFDSFLPLATKDVKLGRGNNAIFLLFSLGVKTDRDEWVYDFCFNNLSERASYIVETYQEKLLTFSTRELDIKWDSDLTAILARGTHKEFSEKHIVSSIYRPFISRFLYYDRHFIKRVHQLPNIFRSDQKNISICFTDVASQKPFMLLAVNRIPDFHLVGAAATAQCLPLYRYDKDGNRIDNITDWGLTQFQAHYNDPTIIKESIFHYTYAVLHHPAYRTKYEINLKREFPRLPFYADFHQWATWGNALMDLHLNYEAIAPYGLKRQDIASKEKPKAKLKADKPQGIITLDENT